MAFIDLILELLFPAECIICEKAGKYLCNGCSDYIPLKRTDLCPLCQKTETFAGRVCIVCENAREKIYLDGVIVASFYKHPILREAIYRFKYSFIQQLAWPLAKILAKKLFVLETFPFEEFVFTAVPLHPKRRQWRGFNQAELLGAKLKKLFEQNNLEIQFIPDLLVREKYFKPQMKIHSTEERKENIVDCFTINPAYAKKIPRKIIIIDDVITTGATLNECAKVLKKHGAELVWSLVLARQSS
jgi:competence protein ComFC